MTSRSQRFALVVLNAFRAAGHYTDQEVGNAGGPSTTTMTTLRKVAAGEGDMPSPRGDTLRKIDKAGEWKPGSARALWETGAAPVESDTRSLAEALGHPAVPDGVRRQRIRQQTAGGIDAFLERLADRVLELEERVDLLEAERRPALLEVAHDEEHTIEEEQEAPEFP